MSTDTPSSPARALGFNHIALEVADIDEALEFYGKIFDVKLRGRGGRMAFIDFGDQFLAIAATGKTEQDSERHFGLVVDDQAKALAAAKAAGAKFLTDGGNTFWDPWGNMFQIVQYSEIQFLKAQPVLEAMGMDDLEKSETALEELRQKGVDVS